MIDALRPADADEGGAITFGVLLAIVARQRDAEESARRNMQRQQENQRQQEMAADLRDLQRRLAQLESVALLR